MSKVLVWRPTAALIGQVGVGGPDADMGSLVSKHPYRLSSIVVYSERALIETYDPGSSEITYHRLWSQIESGAETKLHKSCIPCCR